MTTCATPTATKTHTAMDCLAGVLAWLRKSLTKGEPESSKRLLAALGAVTLCATTATLTGAIVYQVLKHRAVDPQLVIAHGASLIATAGLCSVVYRKPEAA